MSEEAKMETQQLKPVLEAILMVAEQPLSVDRLLKLVPDANGTGATRDVVRKTLDELQSDYTDRGVELAEVASGYRFRTRAQYAEQVGRLWEERKPRYSRAFMETLAIIAYRQPITRGEIEHIRGVAVSTSIMRQLLEREWVRVVGHRDVPGRPAVFATTNAFLDYFGLKSLEALPSLADLKDIDDINADLFADTPPADAVADTDGAAADDDDNVDDDSAADDTAAADEVSPEDLEELAETGEFDPHEALAETGDMEALEAEPEAPASAADAGNSDDPNVAAG